MKVKFIQKKGFCMVGDIVDIPDEQAKPLITQNVVEAYVVPKPKKTPITKKGDE